AARCVLDALGGSLGWSLGYAWQPDPSGEKLELIAEWPSPVPASFAEFARLTRTMRFRRGIGLPGRVWESRSPAWIEDVVDASNFPRARAARRAGLHAGVAFPAMLGDEVLYVFEIFAPETRVTDEEVVRLLAKIGGEIARFADRARALAAGQTGRASVGLAA